MIDTIYNLGDDALSNQGIITFEPLPFMPQMESMQFRITDFSIPDFTVGSYTVRYKTQQFTKPNGSFESGNTFTFNFRVDKYYQIYQNLMTWKQLLANDQTGGMAEDVSSTTGQASLRVNFSVSTLDANNTVTSPGWVFTNAFLKTLGGISFDQASEGDPIMCAVTLEYVKCIPGGDA